MEVETQAALVLIIASALEDAPERRAQTKPNISHILPIVVVPSLHHCCEEISLFSYATKKTSEWRLLKKARSSTLRYGLRGG